MAIAIEDVVGRETRHVLQTYRRQPVTLVRGQGVRLWASPFTWSSCAASTLRMYRAVLGLPAEPTEVLDRAA